MWITLLERGLVARLPDGIEAGPTQTSCANYVERRPDPSDGRARLVCLTDEGRRLARRALREIAAIEDEWRRHFAEAGLDRDLRSVLKDAVRRTAAGRP